MSETTQTVRTLPIFPLPVVVYPGHFVPLHIFEHQYRAMMADVLKGDKCFGILKTDPKTGRLATTGCMIEILDVEPFEDGRMNIEGVGRQRYQLLSVVDDSPYITAEVRLLPEYEPEPQTFIMAEELKDTLQEVIRLSGKLKPQRSIFPLQEFPEDPTTFAFYVPAILYASTEDQQKILEMNSVMERLQSEMEFCSTAIKYMAAVAALKDAFDK
ncbi:MAG: LON peptidase substrate-binding domain-containing protein [Cyanobacteria bacterium TGS_CYA1]|nr:LON peptidase substrate-binding domain-containing protein [Cyanobacteria bacterium TGS_CYA1]